MTSPLPKIGSFQPKSPFFLAPMEAVNCASFRLLCKSRGAALVYTDMIDADVFTEFASQHSPGEAVKKFLNPQPDEQPLAIQLGGANIQNLLFTLKHTQKHATLFDLNIGCPLGYMLGKKGGAYLQKHPNQLYKILKELKKETQKTNTPLTIKIRAGWEKDQINAEEVALEAQNIGINAVTIHPRTRKQRYRDRADWLLLKKIKQNKKLTIPLILSGDVFNTHLAQKAFKATSCDFIMFARAARANPSIFTDLNNWYFSKNKDQPITPPKRIYNKKTNTTKKDFNEWLHLYKTKENRYNLSEIRDHALWTASDCKNNKQVTAKLMEAKNEEEIIKIIDNIVF